MIGRRTARFVATVLAVCLMTPQLAHAETVTELKSRLAELQRENAAAGKEYSQAYWELDETDVKLSKLNKQIEAKSKELGASKRRLSERANAIYRRDGNDTLAFLVGAQSFDQFVTRFEFLSRIGGSDAAAIEEVRTLRSELVAQKKELAEERTQRAAALKQLKAERDRLQSKLKKQEAEFKAVKRKLDAARSGGSLPSGVRGVAGPNGMVFPVSGSYYYADTWGASRSGGRRRHQGTDIMAPRGTPCVAVLSGTVRTKSNTLGGKTIWLTADNGWQFYYAHLDRYVVTSGRVKAGQVIGTVGSTGNAAASSPHLHFEIHPNGGGAVNPYPYLRRME